MNSEDENRALVLFGATGDLARRMLWPSLYALHHDKLLPAGFRIVGTARSPIEREAFMQRVKESILQSSNAPLFEAASFQAFSDSVSYVAADATDPQSLRAIGEALGSGEGGVIFYLSTAPNVFGEIGRALGAAGLVDGASRLVIEKPVGTNAASAQEINEAIAESFAENQVFRIDHYLGKEAVQNLIALRFANAVFEPLWSSAAIEQVQITVAETVGVGDRWGFYDATGALRDMVQSHLLQLLCLVAMEPPAGFTPSAVRNEKVKALWSLRPLTGALLVTHTVTGQYAGYLQEPGAKPSSDTETFVALRAEIDNWRWAGVPFYLRTGKQLQKRASEIVIQFKPAPYNMFAVVGAELAPNMLLIRLQPDEMISLTLMHKKPGLDGVQLGEVALNLSVGDAFAQARRRIAYERMLLDVLRGNSALFVRRDEIDAAWKWIDGIVEGWRSTGRKPSVYAPGSWGPAEALALPGRFGHAWHE
jgi:glucose-6-phosphate 1-dehydrogenase